MDQNDSVNLEALGIFSIRCFYFQSCTQSISTKDFLKTKIQLNHIIIPYEWNTKNWTDADVYEPNLFLEISKSVTESEKEETAT